MANPNSDTLSNIQNLGMRLAPKGYSQVCHVIVSLEEGII